MSIVLNHVAAKAIEKSAGWTRSAVFAAAVAVNLALLFHYKYTYFAWSLAAPLLATMNIHIGDPPAIALPIGISFFTFQALSYIADVYTRHCPAERSFIRFGMYHSLFPQLIAGPIIRYVEIRNEIAARVIALPQIVDGLTRFAIGLAKKTVIADHAGLIADQIFGLGTAATDAGHRLARRHRLRHANPVRFLRLFRHGDRARAAPRLSLPGELQRSVSSQSMTEFWRRWHMTLSRWFRDYLYIPLGGNRKGAVRTYVNLVVVFFLCGLWHGAGYTFIAWGLFHGVVLVIERFIVRQFAVRARRTAAWRRFYAVDAVGWVLFRSPDGFGFVQNRR